MIFHPTKIDGAYWIDIEKHVDQRGFFARTFCQQEFTKHGLAGQFVQSSVAWSACNGTLRGLHYQAAPHQEAKLVRCVHGAACVVIVDIREDSFTFGQWISVELTADNHRSLYVPPGCAQGYQTLQDETEMLYQMSTPYAPGFARGIRYDDPQFQIHWPLAVTAISDADRNWPPFSMPINSDVNSIV